MSKKLFVGNLEWGMTSEDLNNIFSPFGAVSEAIIVTDRVTGRSKGFGFVTFEAAEDADKAIADLDGSDQKGRKMIVSEARPPKPREDRF